jgi:two-component system CheB/CheR fusion protein
MPQDTGLAFVVIQHLAPNRETIMPELLQRKTNMKVELAGEGMKVLPDYVYLIPPNKSLTLHEGVFQLHSWLATEHLRLPVDIFFHSLAEIKNEKSIGVVLSGMGSDGSKGLISIKGKNGLALVQDSASAKFNGMPGSASEAVNVDIIAPAGELPKLLLERLKIFSGTASEMNTMVEKEPENQKAKIKGSLDTIIRLLYKNSGHDFSDYKKSTITRRIERRKGIHKFDSTRQYVQFVQENPEELSILFKELLIGVTNFFRDTALWDELSEKVIPPLLANLTRGQKFRVWVPACSTGEEAYSLAIVLYETLEKLNLKSTIQIFATDLEIDAVEKARRGFFPKNIENFVSKERLKRFFTPELSGYRISVPIREMIIFAQQNVIKDPPFTKLNMLSCRNLLIYLEPALQSKLLSLYEYSLVPGGILVLGSAETAGSLIGLEEINQKLKIFRRTLSYLPHIPIDFPSFFSQGPKISTKDKILPKVTENIQTIADQILLQRFSPASVLVNQSGDIIYVTGRTGRYLEPAAGKANWNIYAMAREGLRQELTGAFRKVAQSYEPVDLRNIKIQNDKNILMVDVTLQRLDKPETVKDMVIVIFSETAHFVSEMKTEIPGKGSSQKKQKALEAELQRSYDEIKITREEMQTSQEELRSINEELQSTNEELQSANEELTTSKEEMQSLNEELQTVNQELQNKVNDLLLMNDDMKNLLNSTEIATLFLDKNLNIRRFTDLVKNIFKLRHTDIGRPFTDLVTQLHYPEMDTNAREVIDNLKSIEKSIHTTDGKWFNVRIMPYRTIDDRIDGLVITFFDITQSKKLELELQKANEVLSKAKLK